MSVTDNFAKLKEQVEKADQTVKAAAELRAKSDEAGRQGESHWQEMQADLDSHIKQVRQRMDA